MISLEHIGMEYTYVILTYTALFRLHLCRRYGVNERIAELEVYSEGKCTILTRRHYQCY